MTWNYLKANWKIFIYDDNVPHIRCKSLPRNSWLWNLCTAEVRSYNRISLNSTRNLISGLSQNCLYYGKIKQNKIRRNNVGGRKSSHSLLKLIEILCVNLILCCPSRLNDALSIPISDWMCYIIICIITCDALKYDEAIVRLIFKLNHSKKSQMGL